MHSWTKGWISKVIGICEIQFYRYPLKRHCSPNGSPCSPGLRVSCFRSISATLLPIKDLKRTHKGSMVMAADFSKTFQQG